MQEVQAAFTDYMARKQNELMERTTSLQKDLDSAKAEAEAKQGELDQMGGLQRAHPTNRRPDRGAGRRARKARETQRAVGASAIAALKSEQKLKRTCVDFPGSFFGSSASAFEGFASTNAGCVASMAARRHHLDAIDAQPLQ